MKGYCKWFRRNAGYGYITAEDGTDYFVHQSQIQMDGYRSLEQGEAVEFTPGMDRHGRPWAEDVKRQERN